MLVEGTDSVYCFEVHPVGRLPIANNASFFTRSFEDSPDASQFNSLSLIFICCEKKANKYLVGVVVTKVIRDILLLLLLLLILLVLVLVVVVVLVIVVVSAVVVVIVVVVAATAVTLVCTE